MSDLIQTVREALSKTTPGPWKVFEHVFEADKPYLSERRIGTTYDHPQLKGPDSIVTLATCAYEPHQRVFIGENDANLIANTPEWLGQLCDHVEALQTANETLNDYLQHKRERNLELLAKIETQEREIERLREALEWVADNTSATYVVKHARQALSHIRP